MISVVMPVYNGEKHLKEAIDSILNQTYTDFEVIILNDASTDRSEEIILSYDDQRIRYVKNETNLQLVKTLNKGIELARGEYIARMDQDDISVVERFEKQLRFMEDNIDIDVCGSYLQTIGAKQEKWIYPTTPESIKISLMFFSPLAHPSVLIRKIFFNSKTYDINYNKAEDYYLWASNINNNKFANIPEYLLFYRLHEHQMGTVYEKDQLALSNKIRLNLLHEFGLCPSEKEFDVHVKLSRYECVDMYDAEKWLHKLYLQNKINNYFDEKVFRKFLDEKWWLVVNQSASIGIKAFFYYYKSKKINKIYKSLMQNIKLIVKCILRYDGFTKAVNK